MAGADISEQVIRCLILDSQSTTTMMFVQPLLAERLTTKLTEMSFHLWSKTGSGFKRPLYVLCKALAYWQV